MALTAAASFRRERETGVLELLLVAPMSANKIISGKLRGLWAQFLPAIVLLIAVQLYLGSLFSYGMFARQTHIGAVLLQASSFISVPVIGLFFSLRCRSFMGAFLTTIGWSLIIPLATATFLRWLFWDSNAPYAVAFSPNGTTLIRYRSFFGGYPGGLSSGWGMMYELAAISTGSAVLCQLGLASFFWMRLIRNLELRRFSLERTQR